MSRPEYDEETGRLGLQALLPAGRVQVEPDSSRPDETAAEAAATQEGGQVEEIAPEAPAVGGGRQEPDVAGQGPQITGVVGQALELEGDAPDGLCPRRFVRAGQGLEGTAVGLGVPDDRVAGDGLGDQHGAVALEPLQ